MNYLVMADQLRADLSLWVREGYTVVAATHQEHRMAEMLAGYGLPASPAMPRSRGRTGDADGRRARPPRRSRRRGHHPLGAR